MTVASKPGKASSREARRYRDGLAEFVLTVAVFLRDFDTLMREPVTVERGRRLADLANRLEMSKDMIRLHILGHNLRKAVEL